MTASIVEPNSEIAQPFPALPAPLTPPECDLQDFAFMPLDVARLRDSDLCIHVTGEEFRCAVLLWCASWHQVPAGSLPDDPKSLASLAGFGRAVSEWEQYKAGALRGWIKCSDGRLYHPVVAEKANESWMAKHRHAHKKLLDRLRKKKVQHEELPSFEDWYSAGMPDDSAYLSNGKHTSSAGKKSPTDGIGENFQDSSAGIPLEKALKGEGQGQGQGEYLKASVPIGTGGEPPDEKSAKQRQVQKLRVDELWSAGVSILIAANMPEAQCRSFLGGLRKEYGDEAVLTAVRAAVVEAPSDPTAWLKAACMASKKEGGKGSIPWHATDTGVIAKGASMTPPVVPHAGETSFGFKTRVIAAVDNGGQAPSPPDRTPPPTPAADEARSFKPAGIGPLVSLVKNRDVA